MDSDLSYLIDQYISQDGVNHPLPFFSHQTIAVPFDLFALLQAYVSGQNINQFFNRDDFLPPHIVCDHCRHIPLRGCKGCQASRWISVETYINLGLCRSRVIS